MQHYVNLEKVGDNLIVSLTKDGMIEAQELLASGKQDIDAFFELLEWNLGDGWDCVTPEDIGALTSDDDVILSDSATYDDHGNLLGVDRVYAWDYYTVDPYVKSLLAGPLTFRGF